MAAELLPIAQVLFTVFLFGVCLVLGTVSLRFLLGLRLMEGELPFYGRLMGAKIGRSVQINSNDLADVSLLEIGDESLIGGDAVLIGHIAEHGILRIKKTIIGRKVTIGLESVMLPKGTAVPARALFAGTPAKFVRSLEEGGEETG